jgi:hypothetical protein
MKALLLLALAQPALASDYIANVGEEVTVGPGGGWVRLFPDNDSGGWNFLWAAGGGYLLLPMSADLQVEDLGRKELTGRDDLVDHAITRCPSGGFLHVASANKESFNDSAYAFRYDDDFNLTASGTLEEAEPDRFHNDLPVVCSPLLNATVFMGSGHGAPSLSIVAEDMSQAELIPLPGDVPSTEGGSLRMDSESGELVVVGHTGQSFTIVGLNSDQEVLWKTAFEPFTDNQLRPYWPQALMKVKEHFLLAFMARNESEGWTSDWGNVYLAVLDSEYAHLETVQISQYSAPEGAMRPGLARRGTQVLLTVDRNVQPQVFEIQLVAEAFGLTGEEDTGEGWDTSSGGDGGADEDTGCGCIHSGPSKLGAWPLMLLVLGVFGGRFRKP